MSRNMWGILFPVIVAPFNPLLHRLFLDNDITFLDNIEKIQENFM